jgi:ribonuclease HI
MYFVSEVLTGSKKYYSEMEKIYYAVITSARKFQHYFEAHTIKVLTNQPLNDISGNIDNSSRISKWVMELLEYVVDFEKRSVIKSHISADFVIEWMEPGSQTEGVVPESLWLIYCNGAWDSAGAGAAAVLISPSRTKQRYAARLQFTNEANKCTNNITGIILLGLHKLRVIRVHTCMLCTNSKVVSNQIEKECIARGSTLEKYLALIRRMENHFEGFTVEYIERSRNTEVDELAKVAAHNVPLPADIFFQLMEDASVKTIELEPRLINLIEGEDWCAPIMAYLLHYYEPNNTTEHIRMQQRGKSYQITDNDLYMTSISSPLLRCISKTEGQELLSEIHTRECRGHIGAIALAATVLR